MGLSDAISEDAISVVLYIKNILMTKLNNILKRAVELIEHVVKSIQHRKKIYQKK